MLWSNVASTDQSSMTVKALSAHFEGNLMFSCTVYSTKFMYYVNVYVEGVAFRECFKGGSVECTLN